MMSSTRCYSTPKLVGQPRLLISAPTQVAPTSAILQRKSLAAGDTHELNDENANELHYQYNWTPLHDQARKQATAELVRCGILRDEYTGASELAIQHRPEPVKGTDGKLYALIPTTKEVYLLFLTGEGLDRGKWVGWTIHSILILNGSIVFWTDTCMDYICVSISVE